MPAASPARTPALPEGAMPLFGDPPPDAPPTRTRAARPPDTGRAPDTGDGAPAPLDPSRWVMTGWRDAERVPLTREQILAVFSGTQGPCAGCGTAHHRYGEGGNPLCPACRAALTANTRP